jgi:hypothetical protein
MWPLLDEAQRLGVDWYYGDHGFFRRGQYFRVTKNAYQPTGDGDASRTRWDALHVNLAPAWQTTGSAVILCPNSPLYMEHHTGMAADEWVDDVTAQIKSVTDRPIILRWKVDAKQRPLYVDLQEAWIVVAYSSASAVEALAAGVPVCTLASWASTARMGISDLAQIETPIYPDIQARDQFLFNLADAQWTLDEIRQGHAWKALSGS